MINPSFCLTVNFGNNFDKWYVFIVIAKTKFCGNVNYFGKRFN